MIIIMQKRVKAKERISSHEREKFDKSIRAPAGVKFEVVYYTMRTVLLSAWLPFIS